MDWTYVLCLLYLIVGKMGGTTILKVGEDREFIAATGENVTLECFINYVGVAKYYWYKQKVGGLPRLVSSFYTFGESGEFSDEFNKTPRFALDIKKGRNHLTISDLQPSDTATYYCASSFSEQLDFQNGIAIIVEGSGLNVSVFDSSQPEGAVTPDCTAHGRAIDEDHGVYHLRTSGQPAPGVLYKWKNNTCLYSLPANSRAVRCAVATCGHLLSKKIPEAEKKDDYPVLVYILKGSLAFTAILAGLLAVVLCKIRKTQSTQREGSDLGYSAFHPINAESQAHEDVLHYAALRTRGTIRPRRQMDDTIEECVYTGAYKKETMAIQPDFNCSVLHERAV